MNIENVSYDDFEPSMTTASASRLNMDLVRERSQVQLSHIVNELKSLEQRHSEYLTLYSLSEKTIEGRDLWVMKISTDDGERSDLKPMVKYVANIHGNEATGRELCLALITYLVDSYKQVRTLITTSC